MENTVTEKTNKMFNFYKENIIDYYNISVIKKILNKYIKTIDFNEFLVWCLARNIDNCLA